MAYIIQDMETLSVHRVQPWEVRHFLNDAIPQGTEQVYNTINFVADYFEGKHLYFSVIPDLMAKLGFRISREDGNLTL